MGEPVQTSGVDASYVNRSIGPEEGNVEELFSSTLWGLEGRTVLVVEDDPVMQMVYDRALTSRGVRVVATSNAEDACQLVQDRHVDLAIVDDQLPGMSGIDLVLLFRAGGSDLDLPIIMVSGNSAPAERVKAYWAGVTDFVAKPVAVLELVAKVAALLHHGDALRLFARGATSADTSSVRARLEQRAWRPFFQPILDLVSRKVVGYEALTRFDDGIAPDVCFAEAHRNGLGAELEIAVIEDAMVHSRLLPGDTWFSVNVSPSTVVRKEFGRLIDRIQRPLIIELLESEAIDDHEALRCALSKLPAGIRLAVDDAGAGWAGLRRLVELRPRIVKLDRQLVSGADADPTRRALIAGLRHFTAETEAQLLAEGIEQEDELSAMVDLGVDLGQGYLLGRPAPVG